MRITIEKHKKEPIIIDNVEYFVLSAGTLEGNKIIANINTNNLALAVARLQQCLFKKIEEEIREE